MRPINLSLRAAGVALCVLASAVSTAADVTTEQAANTLLSAAGNAEKGQRVFNRCRACHILTNAKRTRLGPNLDNIFGRMAGSAENFKYSKALLEADFVWSEEQLNEWLTKPVAFLPGNKMQFAGVRDAQDRKDLIAYLRRATVKAE